MLSRYPRPRRVSPCNCEPPFRRAVPTTPADRVGARVDCFPTRAASPNDRRVGIRIRTFEACSGFTLLRPIGSLSGPRPPSSQGSDPASYPAEPPASFRTNRQLSGETSSLVVRASGRTVKSVNFVMSAACPVTGNLGNAGSLVLPVEPSVWASSAGASNDAPIRIWLCANECAPQSTLTLAP